jgi:hypothetical protein
MPYRIKYQLACISPAKQELEDRLDVVPGVELTKWHQMPFLYQRKRFNY